MCPQILNGSERQQGKSTGGATQDLDWVVTGPLGSITGHYDSLSNINDRVGATGRPLPLAGLNSATKQGSSSTIGTH